VSDSRRQRASLDPDTGAIRQAQSKRGDRVLKRAEKKAVLITQRRKGAGRLRGEFVGGLPTGASVGRPNLHRKADGPPTIVMNSSRGSNRSGDGLNGDTY